MFILPILALVNSFTKWGGKNFPLVIAYTNGTLASMTHARFVGSHMKQTSIWSSVAITTVKNGAPGFYEASLPNSHHFLILNYWI